MLSSDFKGSGERGYYIPAGRGKRISTLVVSPRSRKLFLMADKFRGLPRRNAKARCLLRAERVGYIKNVSGVKRERQERQRVGSRRKVSIRFLPRVNLRSNLPSLHRPLVKIFADIRTSPPSHPQRGILYLYYTCTNTTRRVILYL